MVAELLAGSTIVAALIGLLALGLKLLGWLPGYAKVPKEALLDHGARATIVSKVEEDPGITVAELSDDLSTPYNTVDYHVRRLQRERLLAQLVQGKRKHLYAAQVPSADRPRLAALRNANTVRLLEEIRNHPGSHQRALAAAIHVRPTSLAWHLARLEGSGLVRSARTGRRVVWYTAREASSQVAR
jgi:predicted transcriptional regulator